MNKTVVSRVECGELRVECGELRVESGELRVEILCPAEPDKF